jgi:glyoxylase-like metal-dependent hydrolase (beta-lactamase superfamily II)
MSLGPASQVAPPYRARSLRVGEWRLTALCDGCLRLDGGSMWGVVPAVMWRKLTPPAADNTILLALRPFLAERGDARVLIEGGVGARWEEKWRKIYRIEATTTLDESLAACGAAPGEITHVVASHCHWDHIGSLVVERDGALAPHFPNARHFAPAIEIEMAQHPGHARSGSYRAADVAPLEAAGLLEAYEGERELLPGLRVHPAYGHSDGIHLVTLESAGQTAVFWSDVVPTAHHVQPPYIMAYDIDVVRSFEVRSAWLERAAREGWLGLFYHDPDVAFGRLAFDGRRYICTPVAGEAR